MQRVIFLVVVLVLVTAGAASSSGQRAKADRPASDPNAVLYWSQVAESTISVGRPPASSEVLNGLVHAAIYDATMSVKGQYEPFAVSIRRTGPTSVDAAIAVFVQLPGANDAGADLQNAHAPLGERGKVGFGARALLGFGAERLALDRPAHGLRGLGAGGLQLARALQR